MGNHVSFVDGMAGDGSLGNGREAYMVEIVPDVASWVFFDLLARHQTQIHHLNQPEDTSCQ